MITTSLRVSLVVGKIVWSNKGYSVLVPIKQLVDGQWIDVNLADYPPNGQIFWPSSGQRTEGSLHVFTVRWADSVAEGKEEILVDVERASYSVIDLGHRRWDDAVRQMHAGRVRALGIDPGTVSALVLCRNRELIGPLPIRIEGGYVNLDDRSNQLHRIEIRHNALTVIEVGPDIQLYIPDGRSDDHVDCRTDAEVLRSALTDAADITRKSGGIVPDLASSRRFINETVQSISESGKGVESALRLERALRVVEFQEALELSAGRLIGDVLEVPRVKAAIDEAIEEARADAGEEARRISEARMADETSELSKLTAQRIELEDTVTARRAQLQAELAKLESEMETFESHLIDRLDGATADAGELLAESMLLRMANGAGGVMMPTKVTVREPFLDVVSDAADADPVVLESAARNAGLSSTVLVRIHEILHAGLLPILTGTGAMTALYTYAHVALGGRIAELPVTHDFLRPTDLLGVRASGPGQPRLHGNLLSTAQRDCTPENPGLVVLDGFNCGASEAYLLPWLSHPRKEIALRAAGSESVVHWGDGLMLAAIAGTGMTTAPMGVEFWSYAALVDVPAPERSVWETPAASTIAPPNSVEVSGELAGILNEVIEAISPVFETRIDLSRTMYALAESHVVTPNDSSLQRAQLVVECVVVPALATVEISPPGLVDDVIADVAPIVGLDAERFENLVARARRALG